MDDTYPMDPDVSVLLHCAAWRGLLESQVQVELSERFNCQIDAALECHIEEVWAERVSKEPWLFNGAKFRLHSFSLASPESPPPSPSISPSPKNTPYSISPQPPYVNCAGDRADRQHSCHREEDNFCDTDPATVCGAAKQNSETGNAPGHRRENGDCVVQPRRCCPTCSKHKESASDKLYLTSDRSGCERNSVAAGGITAEPCSCSGRQASPLLTLRLGLTCYKDFLGTNWSWRASELRRRGEAEFGDPLALLAQPLGVGGVLCTCDGQVVLIRRSQKVAEAGGLLDIPGGHPEPKAVCEGLGQSVCEDQISVAVLQQRRGAVVTELFSSVCAEIRDEVNVPLSCQGEPVLMGIALNHTSAGRPSAEFYISCSLTSAEVRELYWRGGAEAHESTDIVFLSKTEMLRLDKDTPLWSELCPSAKGAVLLYQLVMPDREQDRNNPPQSQDITPENGFR